MSPRPRRPQQRSRRAVRGHRADDRALGLTGASTTASDAGGLQVAVRFIEGNHSSILIPDSGPTPTAEEIAAWAEMQSQAASFRSPRARP